MESDNAQFNMFSSKKENPFLSKIGNLVMGKSMFVKAEPTLQNFEDSPVLGSYDVDEEGVKAQEVNLIENGKLKQVMMSRSPVKGFDRSNGHFRGGTSSPSVVHLGSSEALSYKALKEKLFEMLQEEELPYGYIIKSIIPPTEAADLAEMDFQAMFMGQFSDSPSQIKLSRPVAVFKVYPDGKEELVRGMEFESLNLKTFKDLTIAGDDAFAYNYPISSSELPFDMSIFGMSNLKDQIFATIISPSFIIEEIDLSKSSGSFRKPPIVSYPAIVLQ